MKLGWLSYTGLVTTLAAASTLAQALPPGSAAERSTTALLSTSKSASPVQAEVSGKSAKAGQVIRALLTPDRETTLSSPVSARLKQLPVSLGISFSAGQTLIEFDCEEPLARLDMAKAELTGAVETHEAKVRMQGLEQASDVEVALAASAVDKGRAQVMLQRAQVKQCAIVAPWAGRIAKVHVRSYMSVIPGQPLIDLVKSGPLKLRLNVPSRALSQIAVGQLFDVLIDETGKVYQARVNAINSRVDSVSQTIELEGSMTRLHTDLLPGMSGTAQLTTPTVAR